MQKQESLTPEKNKMIESTLAYFMPLFSFLLVFILVFALLAKTKLLGENAFLHLFISFVIAIIFFVSPTAQEFTKLSMPWVGVFIVCLIIIMLTLAFVGGNIESVISSPILAKVAIVALLIIFLVSAIQVFGPVIEPYLPGAVETGGDDYLLSIKHTIFHPTIVGSVLLLAIAAVVSWVLTKK